MKSKLFSGVVSILVLMSFISFPIYAEVVQKTVEYKDGATVLTGEIYYDNSIKGKRPGILVIHEWWGLNDYAKKRAKMLAEMGYVAFAADMYGEHKVTKHAKDAKGWMMQITGNIDAWQQRASLGLQQLKDFSMTDASKTAAIGYCFGGATVMQLAYSGADVGGVVSFHGSLPVASEAQAKAIKSKVMIAHGYADSFIPKERIAQFKESLEMSGVDWQFDSYSGAKHGFTNPTAGDYGMDALAYSETADKRSWQKMQNFFNEIFDK